MKPPEADPVSHAPAWLRAHGRPWQRGKQTEVFENPWMRVSDFQAIAPTGREARHVLVHFKNLAIIVLPLHEDGTVTLVGQNRFPFAEHVWELPAGGGHRSDPPLLTAQRELREETGLEATDWHLALRLQLSNSMTDELGFGFLATGLTSGAAEPDPTEDIALARVPFAEALRAAVDGHITDAPTVAMSLRCHHMAVSGELDERLARIILSGDGG